MKKLAPPRVGGFIHKMQIVLKEIREARYSLKLIEKSVCSRKAASLSCYVNPMSW